eukprot:4257-Heterococcus_DN1.PRE.2
MRVPIVVYTIYVSVCAFPGCTGSLQYITPQCLAHTATVQPQACASTTSACADALCNALVRHKRLCCRCDDTQVRYMCTSCNWFYNSESDWLYPTKAGFFTAESNASIAAAAAQLYVYPNITASACLDVCIGDSNCGGYQYRCAALSAPAVLLTTLSQLLLPSTAAATAAAC